MSVPPLFTMPKNILFSLGLPYAENTFYQLSHDELIRQCLERDEGALNDTAIHTGKFTGHSPKGRFIVKDKITATPVDWNDINQPVEEKYFDGLYRGMIEHLSKKEIWIRDAYTCADPECRMNIRTINEDPAGNLFAYNMFLHPDKKELENFNPDWYIIHASTFSMDTKDEGIQQDSFIIANFTRKVILIGGSVYNNEVKKEILSVLNSALLYDKKV